MKMVKQNPKEKQTVKQILKKKQGATLVEMVVTFALLAIFFSGISMVLYRAMETYHQIQGLNYAEQVSDTLMDKIAGTISGANPSSPDKIDETYTMKIYENGTVIELYDHTSSPIAITTTHTRTNIKDSDETSGNEINLSEREEYTKKNNQLLIFYYKVKEYEAVDWTFGDGMYMGFKIESLTFHQADASGVTYPKNVIRIDLSLKSDRYSGTFESTRYVECYNFSTDELEEKIYDDSVISPDPEPEPEPDPTPDPDPEPTPDPDPEPTPDPDPEPEPGGDGHVTLTDSSGGKHTLIETGDWKVVREQIASSWPEVPRVLVDETGTYVFYDWNVTLHDAGANNMTLQEFAAKYPQKIVKIESNHTIYTTADTVNNGTQWKEVIPQKSLCFYDGHYYVAPSEVGAWTFPSGGWALLY